MIMIVWLHKIIKETDNDSSDDNDTYDANDTDDSSTNDNYNDSDGHNPLENGKWEIDWHNNNKQKKNIHTCVYIIVYI